MNFRLFILKILNKHRKRWRLENHSLGRSEKIYSPNGKKHTEYGMKFRRKKVGKEVHGAIVPISGDADALCHMLACMHLGVYLPSIDSLLINPINDYIGNRVSELEPFDAGVVTIEFTTDSALLIENSTVLQSVPLTDFKLILEEWRDFLLTCTPG